MLTAELKSRALALALALEPVGEPDSLLVPEPGPALELESEPEPVEEALPEALLDPAEVVLEADEDWVAVARVVDAVDDSVESVEEESLEELEIELELWLKELESPPLILMLLLSPDRLP